MPADRRGVERQDEPASLSGGVPLSRLLAVARLSAGQALEIGAGVLVAADAAPGGAGPDRAPVAVAPMIDADGRVVLGSGAGRGPGHDPGGARVRPVGAVVAEVAAAARLTGALVDPAADRVADPRQADPGLAELDRAVRDLPTDGLRVIARRVQEVACAVDQGVVRAELAALVTAVRGDVGRGGGTPPAGGHTGTAGPAWAVRAGQDRTRSARRRIGAWVLSFLVLAAVVLLEVVVLRDRIGTDIGLLLDAGRNGSAQSAGPGPDGLPIEAPAPSAAGGVRGVDLRAFAPCAPAAPCTLRLQVRLQAGAEAQVVTWTYLIVDRCTGAASTAPGGTVTVPAQGRLAAAVATVAVPDVRGAALVAVVRTPAAAASAPVLVGSCLPAPNAE